MWQDRFTRVEKGELFLSVCTSTHTHCFRKGPLGPKTLCNAGGLRWAKKARKTGDEGDGDAGQNGPSAVF